MRIVKSVCVSGTKVEFFKTKFNKRTQTWDMKDMVKYIDRDHIRKERRTIIRHEGGGRWSLVRYDLQVEDVHGMEFRTWIPRSAWHGCKQDVYAMACDFLWKTGRADHR